MKITVKHHLLAPLFHAFQAFCAADLSARWGARFDRNRDAVAKALVPVEQRQEKVCLEHGAKRTRTGLTLEADAPGYAQALAELRALMDDEVEVELQTIPLEEIEDVHVPRAGDHVGLLLRLGIVTEPPASEEELPPAVAARARNGKKAAHR